MLTNFSDVIGSLTMGLAHKAEFWALSNSDKVDNAELGHKGVPTDFCHVKVKAAMSIGLHIHQISLGL